MFCASPPAALALATITVAPSVTRVGSRGGRRCRRRRRSLRPRWWWRPGPRWSSPVRGLEAAGVAVVDRPEDEEADDDGDQRQDDRQRRADRRARVADSCRRTPSLGVGTDAARISRIAHVYLPDAHAPPCCCLGERVVPSVVCGVPSINDRLRRRRRRWKRRTTSGSWRIAPGCSSTWSSSASYSSGLQPKRALISSSRLSSNCHHVRSKSSTSRWRSVSSSSGARPRRNSLTRVHAEVEDGASDTKFATCDNAGVAAVPDRRRRRFVVRARRRWPSDSPSWPATSTSP